MKRFVLSRIRNRGVWSSQMDTLIDGNETNKEEKERKTTFANTIIDLLSLPAMMASDDASGSLSQSTF